jgi:hypothetical protein
MHVCPVGHTTPSHGSAGCPQTFGVPPPPQVAGGVHWPQSSVPPQPSAIGPQSTSGVQVRGAH